MIEVKQTGHSEPLAFEVTIREAAGETHHNVTMSRTDYDRLTNGTCQAERCIEAAFRFLLDHEPKEAIQSRFDVSVISHYFPDFEAKLAKYIASSSPAGDGS